MRKVYHPTSIYIKSHLHASSLIVYGLRMSGKKSDLGPIGANVTQAVRKFREARGLGYAELSRRLAELGREIPSLGLRRIEAGERRVDADDLVALALALDVTPLALLLPSPADGDDHRLASKGDPMPWQHIWVWATGQGVLSGDRVTYVRDCNPLKWAEVEATVADFGGTGGLSATVRAVQPQQDQ